MARLTRKNIKVFAGSATNNGVFGSAQANNPTTTNDVEQIQTLSAWSEGWDSATMTGEKLPPLEEFQGVQYVITYQQAYIMQEGLPEWAASVTYYKGSLAKEVTPTGFKIYSSLTDNNTGNLLSDTGNWKLVMDSDGGYAIDSDVVHKAGTETISGNKTFSGNNTYSGSSTFSGNASFSQSPTVPTPTATDSSTKAASTAFVKNAMSTSGAGLATISKARKGYCKFTNGLIIQWGSVAKGATRSVTFATNFTSTNYTVTANIEGDTGYVYACGITNKATNGMTIRTYGGASDYVVGWIAIGY